MLLTIIGNGSMTDLKDKRVYHAYWALICGAAIGLAIAASSANAAERHQPQARPVTQTVNAKPTSTANARAENGGNEFSSKTDGDSNVGVMYAAPSFSSSFGAFIGDGTATVGHSVGFPVIGGGYSSQDARPTYGVMMSDEMAYDFWFGFFANLDDPTTRAMWAQDIGHNVSQFDIAQGKARQSMIRGFWCTDGYLQKVVEFQNIECE